MRMKMEILPPCVQNSQKTDGGAQMLRVRRDRQQRLGHGLEQDAVDSPGVLKCQDCDLLR